MDSHSGDNTFAIITQPKQNFHYRYVSELNSSHGVVTGQQQQLYLEQPQQNTEETFPTIRLRLPANDDDCQRSNFFVLCSLHSYNSRPLSLSPHVLMKKDRTKLEYKHIFEQMDENPTDPLERTWQLKNYVIVRLKTEVFQRSLREKQIDIERLNLPLEFEQFKGDVVVSDTASVKKSGILNVCLGFTIFERDINTGTYRLYKDTIYSDNIFHGDDLKIHELCNVKGSIDGNTNVSLLIKLQSGYDYNVHMYRHKANTYEIEWEEIIPISNHNIFSNSAITFKLPKGPPDVDADEIDVMLEVVVAHSTYRSQNVRFQYMNNTEDVVRRKIPRRMENLETSAPVNDPLDAYFDASPTNDPSLLIPNLRYEPTTELYPVSELFSTLDIPSGDIDNLIPHYRNPDIYISRDKVSKHIGREIRVDNDKVRKSMQFDDYKKPIVVYENLKDSIARVLDMSADAGNINIVKVQYGNTIFHEAIKDQSSLLCLHRHMKTTIYKSLVLKARNNFGHNLLHYACSQNKPHGIRPLVGMGCSLYEQDLQGRTPLHIAIERNNATCIAAIQDLLMDHSKYEANVEAQLIHMFKVYSHRGHTVLHAAVLANLPDLVKTMLEFCKNHKVDILQYEVLGNGDSIAHLMVKENLVDMIQLVKEYVPNYLTIQNYPGQTVLDLPDLSLVMFEAINVK